MVEQDGELVARDVVAARGQQDRPRRAVPFPQLLELARQLVELVRVVDHLLQGVALVGHRLDLVGEALLELLEDVEERVVEPGVAFGHEQAPAFPPTAERVRARLRLWASTRRAWSRPRSRAADQAFRPTRSGVRAPAARACIERFLATARFAIALSFPQPDTRPAEARPRPGKCG